LSAKLHDAKLEQAQVRQSLPEDPHGKDPCPANFVSESESTVLDTKFGDLELCTTDEERSISQLEKWSDNGNLVDVTAFLRAGMFMCNKNEIF
jgi:hypothetical protein